MKQLNWYRIFGNTHTVPEGSTVTPTDDVQILLHCANIWDKSYTTIGEVIADDDTLFLTLIDNNAIDYLVRSTTFASSIVADEASMEYIGANDYAAETLLSDATWNEAIMASEYKDDVVNVSVPTMTSNTAPSGECICSTNVSSYEAYKAFDGVKTTSDSYASNTYTASDNAYVGYKFAELTLVKAAVINTFFVNQTGTEYFAVEGLDSGNQWQLIKDNISISIPATNTIYSLSVGLPDSDKYIGFRLRRTNFVGYNERLWIPTLQFYGREIGGVQTWLAAGGITNKKYTTVSEVLSDLTTLATLMSSTDAIDYLVTAKGWATEICSDSNAMADIGMNNYAANTLLADATWCDAIANSTYRESVFNVKVPIMTSNTQPYGVASASAVYSSGNRQPYYPFSGLDNQYWCNGRTAHNDWIQYQFVSAQKVVAFTLASGAWASKDGIIKDFTLSASNDGVTFDTLGSFTSANDDILQVFSVSNSTAYSYYRITETSRYDNGDYTWVHTIQFYGRKDV